MCKSIFCLRVFQYQSKQNLLVPKIWELHHQERKNSHCCRLGAVFAIFFCRLIFGWKIINGDQAWLIVLKDTWRVKQRCTFFPSGGFWAFFIFLQCLLCFFQCCSNQARAIFRADFNDCACSCHLNERVNKLYTVFCSHTRSYQRYLFILIILPVPAFLLWQKILLFLLSHIEDASLLQLVTREVWFRHSAGRYIMRGELCVH